MVFLGTPGVGKTIVAVALAVAACQAGFSTQANMLFSLISRRYERGSTIITGMGAAHTSTREAPWPGPHPRFQVAMVPSGATCSVQDISVHIALDLRARALIMLTAQASVVRDYLD